MSLVRRRGPCAGERGGNDGGVLLFSTIGNGRTFSRRNLHGQVVHEIGTRILGGEFPPGAVLPSEARLGAELRVSRTALREAIKVLAAKGLIESRTKIGTRVRPREQWNILDPDILAWAFSAGDAGHHAIALTEVRRILEPAAAALAARRAAAEGIAGIQEAYDGMVAAVDDAAATVAADLLFHQSILAATGNEFLAPMGYLIESALAASFKLSGSTPAARRKALPLHAAILGRIRDGDAAGAEAAMHRLLRATKTDIEIVTGRRGKSARAPRPRVRGAGRAKITKGKGR